KVSDAADQRHVDPDDARPVNGSGKTNGAGASAVPGPRRRSAEELVDEIRARASEPWVSLGLEGIEITRLRLGSFAALVGGPGAGKSTLAMAVSTEHARHHGPAIILSLELGADEFAARAIGMAVVSTWEDVLRGRVDRDKMIAALPPRLDVRDR